jgi:predicted TIM-barrel fold metal-dependent hydrolase
MRSLLTFLIGTLLFGSCIVGVRADDIKKTPLYARLKMGIDAVPAIDTHDHLRPFDQLPNLDETDRGRGMTLHSIFAGSYYPGINKLSPWPMGGSFDAWWATAKHDFDDARATSFYRYLLPGFRDLYGIDFDVITDEQAKAFNDKIFANYKDDKWLLDVVTRRANIELMFIDSYWARLQFAREYKFAVPVLNVTMMMSGYHRDRFDSVLDSPYVYAERRGKKIENLDDYLAAVELIFQDAVAADTACLKSTQAYLRTLSYERVSKERAAAIFGTPPDKITPEEVKAFEDFMFWHVAALSAKHELPFQIHTGQARIQGSNPMLLVELIQANPHTKFILFHGGFPWVGETAVIGMKCRNVWIDSCWLPTLSYTMGKRAYQEWLESMPSDRILWGADTVQAEGIYSATEFTRQCLAEALAEKVDRGELHEAHAAHIGRQIMRENALKLFPKLKRQLWRADSQTADSQKAGESQKSNAVKSD